MALVSSVSWEIPPTQSTSLLPNPHSNYHSIDHSSVQSASITSPNSPSTPNNQVLLPLPRPRLWPILLFLGLLDLAASFYFLVDRHPADLVILNPNRSLILIWTFTRGFSITLTSASRRIRTLGWVFAGTGMISLLLLLWTTNEFIQKSHQPGHIPATNLSLVSFLAITLLLFFFPFAHWFAFLIAVGVTNARNPFVGSSLGFGNATRSEYWNWAETSAEDALERVVLLDDEAEPVEQEQSEACTRPAPAVRRVTPTSLAAFSSSSADKLSSASAGDERDQVSISSSSTSNTTVDEEPDDEEADPDDILDIPAPSVTPLTPSLHFRSFGSSTSFRSRASTLRTRNSWLSKQAAVFEEAEERRRLRRTSLPHHRTPSCNNACHSHLPYTESLPTSLAATPKPCRNHPAVLETI